MGKDRRFRENLVQGHFNLIAHSMAPQNSPVTWNQDVKRNKAARACTPCSEGMKVDAAFLITFHHSVDGVKIICGQDCIEQPKTSGTEETYACPDNIECNKQTNNGIKHQPTCHLSQKNPDEYA